MQRIAACLFAGFQIGFSYAAHIVARPTRSDNKAVCKDAVCSWYRLNVDNGKCYDAPHRQGHLRGWRGASATCKKSNPDLDFRGNPSMRSCLSSCKRLDKQLVGDVLDCSLWDEKALFAFKVRHILP
jgi:hypothetical protein